MLSENKRFFFKKGQNESQPHTFYMKTKIGTCYPATNHQKKEWSIIFYLFLDNSFRFLFLSSLDNQVDLFYANKDKDINLEDQILGGMKKVASGLSICVEINDQIER